jgi:ArsR family transcriptional regulator
MIKKELLDKDKLTRGSEIFKILGSVIRLRILFELKRNACNVKYIHQKLGLRQTTVSQQLKILKMSGIVTGLRKGNTVCYRLSNQIVKEAMKLIEK